MPRCSRPGPTPRASAAAWQIAPNGMHVLAEMGLADELVRRGSIAESFDFIRNRRPPRARSTRTCRPFWASRPLKCARATLNEVLINKAWCENVALYFEKRLVAIEDRADRPVVAHFADAPRPKAISSSAPMACTPRCARMSSPTADPVRPPA